MNAEYEGRSLDEQLRQIMRRSGASAGKGATEYKYASYYND